VYVGARLAGGAAAILLPLATGPEPVLIAMCMASFFFVQAALANSNVLSTSLRSALTPERLRGRMNASARTVVYGVLPLGGLAGGLLAGSIGSLPTLWLGALGYAASVIPILASPVRRLRVLPGTG
jgi:hypothetical protein